MASSKVAKPIESFSKSESVDTEGDKVKVQEATSKEIEDKPETAPNANSTDVQTTKHPALDSESVASSDPAASFEATDFMEASYSNGDDPQEVSEDGYVGSDAYDDSATYGTEDDFDMFRRFEELDELNQFDHFGHLEQFGEYAGSYQDGLRDYDALPSEDSNVPLFAMEQELEPEPAAYGGQDASIIATEQSQIVMLRRVDLEALVQSAPPIIINTDGAYLGGLQTSLYFWFAVMASTLLCVVGVMVAICLGFVAKYYYIQRNKARRRSVKKKESQNDTAHQADYKLMTQSEV